MVKELILMVMDSWSLNDNGTDFILFLRSSVTHHTNVIYSIYHSIPVSRSRRTQWKGICPGRGISFFPCLAW